jgi:hypothetical protein
MDFDFALIPRAQLATGRLSSRSGRRNRAEANRSLWEALRSTWDEAQAQQYLSDPLQLPLPTSGPLYDLLAKTKGLLDLPVEWVFEMPRAEAEQAKSFGCIALLTKLMHWTQQTPCMELHSVDNPEGCPSGSLWWLVSSLLAGVLKGLGLARAGDNQRHWECMQQCNQTAGKFPALAQMCTDVEGAFCKGFSADYTHITPYPT